MPLTISDSQKQMQQVQDAGRAILRETAVHTALTFFSTLAIQLTTFAILASSALVMPTEAFARLSLIVAAVMLSNSLFELGLNVTSTKMFGDTGDDGYFRSAFAVRLVCLPVALVMGGAFLQLGWGDTGLGIILGAVLNVWNGVRATDQARQDYRSFVRSSVAFAAVRGIVGILAMVLTKDPVITAIATYAVPVAAGGLSASAKYVREAFSGPRPPIRASLWYATHVYLNALTFIAIPYVPQFFIAARLDPVAVGTYGLILSFSGPVALLIYTFYSVLLPKMLGPNAKLEEMLWSWLGIAAICVAWFALLSGGGILVLVLENVFAARFPTISASFFLYFSGTSLSSLLGMYSLSVHTQGVPQLNTIVSVVRLFVLFGVLLVFGETLIATILATLIILILGQISLIFLLWVRRKSNKNGSKAPTCVA